MSKSIKIRKEKFYSFVWIIPIVAVCIAFSLVYSTHFNKGPKISLILNSADGLEAGKTAIKTKSVEVGKIVSISLTDDLKHVIAEAQMNKDVAHLLNNESKFWIEKPRVDRKGVSGLSTILSGYYIEMLPSKIGKPEKTFVVLDEPPADLDSSNGLYVSLISTSNKKITAGDIIRFKGMTAGSVVTADYDFRNHYLVYNVVIKPPFDKIVTNSSRFWISSGISATMGAEGFHIDTDSFESIISGGISFDTPDVDVYSSSKPGTGHRFTLYDNFEEISNRYDDDKTIDFVILLNKPPKGLVYGSPVYFSGVQVGIVKKVPYFKQGFELFYDEVSKSAVMISIQMQRFEHNNNRSVEELRSDIVNLIQNKNLTASVETLNLLTQRNMISLYEEIPANGGVATSRNDIEYFDGYVVIPSQEIDFSGLQQDIATFAHNLSELKINEMVDNVNALIKSSTQTSDNLAEISKNINLIVEKLQRDDISGELLDTLNSLRQTLNSYGEDSPLYSELHKSLKNLNDTVSSLKPVMRKVDEKSNSLVFSYDKQDPQPKAAK